MRAFAEAWPERSIVHQLGAQLPWKHNCLLLDRVKNEATRTFYIKSAIEHGWARSVLSYQIDKKLHARQGAAITNFSLTLPPPQSDLAREMLKDPYIFRPAPLDETANERGLEKALVARLQASDGPGKGVESHEQFPGRLLADSFSSGNLSFSQRTLL